MSEPNNKWEPVITAAATLLVVSGLLHGLPLLTGFSDWQGEVSARKPFLFGISSGLTLFSIGYLGTLVNKSRKVDDLSLKLVGLSLLAEVGLITLQFWRNVRSHFNQATVGDQIIDLSMFALISIVTVGVIYWTVRSFSKLKTTRDQQLAIRAGMLLLLASCCVGFVISGYGYSELQSGRDPKLVPPRGVPKFPHGIAIHAVQILPLFAFALNRIGVRLEQRANSVYQLGIAFLLLLIYASLQTALGLDRWEISPATPVLVLGIFSAVVACWLPTVSYIGLKINQKKANATIHRLDTFDNHSN